MVTKTCNTCNLTLDISKFRKRGKWYRKKCKQCIYNSRTCEHGKRKDLCCEGDCNGIGMCKHGKNKRFCIEGDCNGRGMCEHGRMKYVCIEGDCNGNARCEHGNRKVYCNEGDCQGAVRCEHGRIKYDCNEGDCNGSSRCEHGRIKARCKECGGSAYCEHGQRKDSCPKCGGNSLCIHCKMIHGRSRYVESLDKKVRCCARCFYNFYPNDEIPRRYKLKQHYFNEKLIEEFGADFFQYDKRIKCGCSGRMPDWFIDCFKYSIIIELDEDQHKYRSCDDKRMMELFKDLGNRPLVLIRINPDKYKGKTKKRKGCFDFDERNILICNEKKFNKRFNTLVEMIKYYLNNEPEKEVTMQKLFFNKN